jgi:large subunit ribosomal protein L21
VERGPPEPGGQPTAQNNVTTLVEGTKMYAVIKTGGKQYRVAAGDKLRVEKLAGDVGAEISLGEVLLVAGGEATKVGTPTIAGASVTATVVEHGLGDKVRIFKMRRRKHYKKSQGHRQAYTEIRITGINA